VHEGTGLPVRGYEIHMGESRALQSTQPLVRIRTRNGQDVELLDGATNPDGRVWGCYVHGLFDAPEFRRHFLDRARAAFGLPAAVSVEASHQNPYDRLADAFEQHLDLALLWKILESGV
jgi:adenosylcobyric acid synthase